MNTAIIVAAGSGSRFKSDTPKQFLELLGRPLLFHAIDRFESCDAIDEVVLALAAEQIERFEKLGGNFSKLRRVVAGGRTRAESVRNALGEVDPRTEIIAVHDGARPMVSPEEIRQTVERAAETGAACLAAPVIDTIKHVEGGFISGTLDRTRLRRALTPQAFKYEILKNAYISAELSEAVTDECYLVEKLGCPIAVVDGDPRNIKVTHRQDLDLAEQFLRQELEK